MRQWQLNLGQRSLNLSPIAILWVLAAVLLFLGTFIRLAPHDYLLVLRRANPFILQNSTTPAFRVTDSSQDRLLVTYNVCRGEADADEPLTEQRFFDAANCDKVANPGDTVWFRIILENDAPLTLTNFAIADTARGEILPVDSCWRVDIPLRARPNPDAGWSGGQAGVLPADGGKAVCIYPYELGDSIEDPLLYNLDVRFSILTEEAAGAAATDDTVIADLPVETISASNFMHVFEDFPLTPNIWLPTFGIDSTTLIGISSENIGLPVFLLPLLFLVLEVAMFNFWGTNNKLLTALIRTIGVFLIFWSFFGHEIFWDNFLGLLFPSALERTGDIELLRTQNSVIGYAADHLELVIVSSLVIIPVGLLLGIFVTRPENLDYLPFINNLVNSGQTVPTIAVVAIMAPIIGIGFRPAIFALIIYGMLPVVRNTIAGLEGVDPFMKDSAKGMGMTPTQVLFSIELPIASKVIMAGVRTSMVINVGTAALGAYVASGGLGDPIAAGLLRQVDPWIVLGAVPAALLAVLLDYVLGRVEFVVTPKGLQIE